MRASGLESTGPNLVKSIFGHGSRPRAAPPAAALPGLLPQPLQLLCQAGQAAAPSRFVQHQLAGRHQLRPVQALGGALGRRVEAAQRLDLVAEELDAQGLARGRVDVDDAAARGQLPGALHLLDPLVARRDEPGQQRIALEPLSRLQVEETGRPLLGVGQAARDGGHRGHDDARPLPDAGQGLEAGGGEFGAGRQDLEGQHLDGGEDHHAVRRHPGAQVGGEGVRRALVRGEHEEGPPRGGGQGHQEARRRRPRDAMDRLGGQFPAHPSRQGGELRQLLPQAQELVGEVLGRSPRHVSPPPPTAGSAPADGHGVGPL